MANTFVGRFLLTAALVLSLSVGLTNRLLANDEHRQEHDDEDGAKTLYIWAGDQARRAPDFLAVVDFDEESSSYGKVLKTVPIPAPGNIGNEPHHCHLSANKQVLARGGLLSVLKGQNGIFFFDVSKARDPKFLFSASAPQSAITDDFYPLPEGGFLITQMGSASGCLASTTFPGQRQLYFPTH